MSAGPPRCVRRVAAGAGAGDICPVPKGAATQAGGRLGAAQGTPAGRRPVPITRRAAPVRHRPALRARSRPARRGRAGVRRPCGGPAMAPPAPKPARGLLPPCHPATHSESRSPCPPAVPRSASGMTALLAAPLALLLGACGPNADLSVAAGTGANPQLPPPKDALDPHRAHRRGARLDAGRHAAGGAGAVDQALRHRPRPSALAARAAQRRRARRRDQRPAQARGRQGHQGLDHEEGDGARRRRRAERQPHHPAARRRRRRHRRDAQRAARRG